MKLLRKYGPWAALLAAGGLLIAWSGILPLAASSGHWAVTEWFLHFTMRRTVKARTIGTRIPPLDDPALVLRGAGHFETGCRPCHGAPGAGQPVTLRHMTPRAPFLPERVPHWEPEELFWIVKHGVKFTGMPGWPVQEREDEVWAMVAFLQRLPEMGPEEYQRLATGEADSPSEGSLLEGLGDDPPGSVLESCVRCHGAEGLGRGLGAFPRLAGQSPRYLHASLQAYAEGRRLSGIMQPVAAGLSEETMQELARFYGGLPAGGPERILRADRSALSRGEAIAERGLPGERVPSCADCHGPTRNERRANYPILAGQYADYLVLQLELFKAGLRGGSAYAHLMDPVVHNLTREQMEDVALYYASLQE